jgi:hypothetical protein
MEKAGPKRLANFRAGRLMGMTRKLDFGRDRHRDRLTGVIVLAWIRMRRRNSHADRRLIRCFARILGFTFFTFGIFVGRHRTTDSNYRASRQS